VAGWISPSPSSSWPPIVEACWSPCAATGGPSSPTDDRAKTVNLRRDPRAQLYVTREDFFAYVVLDGTASLSPVAEEVDDPVVDELVEMYRLASGEHPDWDEFRRAMVDQRRVVATLTATHAYGQLGH
jgi:PPOX class probable F420-dependent enzyme